MFSPWVNRIPLSRDIRKVGERMRWTFWAMAATAFLATGGCSNTPGRSAKLEFDPGLALKWPGTPSEKSQVIPTPLGDQKHYDASYTEQTPEGTLVFSAFVMEYPERALE